MNFFGHAAVARHVDDDPAFVLGAMAPDLLAMCGATGEHPASARVAAGQAHHLAVDAAFHGSAAFATLQSWAVGNLVARGLRRGPARGAAHVGIELLLDGELACDGPARAAYARSLDVADGACQPFRWPEESAGSRWRTLVRRLRSGTIPDSYRQPDFVADRLDGALRGRPRLALTPTELVALRAFLPWLQQRVAIEVPALMCDAITMARAGGAAVSC
ncbi:MAG TPA: hypothetical protein VHO67_15645 [Polyangia bacterium]|nr:hypothetical protein [Polyangia bacterium]